MRFPKRVNEHRFIGAEVPNDALLVPVSFFGYLVARALEFRGYTARAQVQTFDHARWVIYARAEVAS